MIEFLLTLALLCPFYRKFLVTTTSRILTVEEVADCALELVRDDKQQYVPPFLAFLPYNMVLTHMVFLDNVCKIQRRRCCATNCAHSERHNASRVLANRRKETCPFQGFYSRCQVVRPFLDFSAPRAAVL